MQGNQRPDTGQLHPPAQQGLCTNEGATGKVQLWRPRGLFQAQAEPSTVVGDGSRNNTSESCINSQRLASSSLRPPTVLWVKLSLLISARAF